jgi:predicted amidophosphoribosyltransferase
MKCPTCQHFNDVAARSCAECAAPLAGTCVHCGHQLPPSARFCPQCAQPTDAASVQAGSPQDYTPEHLAKKILGSRDSA